MKSKIGIVCIILWTTVICQDVSFSNSDASSSDVSPQAARSAPVAASRQGPNCKQTENGCKCKSQWMYLLGEGEVQRGCANPDQDVNGLWCAIEHDSCDPEALGLPAFVNTQRQPINWFDTIEYIDYCPKGCPQQSMSEISCNTTVLGCECKGRWTHATPAGRGTFKGCVNIDNDPNGPWCKVDESSCPPDAIPLLGSFQDSSERYDTCACQGLETAEDVRVTDCETDGGCLCLSTWTYQTYAGEGCDNPDKWEEGPWCVVSSTGPDGTPCSPRGTLDQEGNKLFDTCSCKGTDKVSPTQEPEPVSTSYVLQPGSSNRAKRY
eukprot:TRINITY_DN11001_c0_g1_i1.p1 TRINITY_DN11001_c0_g1~~TRINITY_DN11001_c0_g1_i1.p1  ORF type:complete len:337 (+),score=17.06 TRINITY_DN11001_c0_g1_i1:48-1013(+)